MQRDERKPFGLCPLHHPDFWDAKLDRRGFLRGVAVASAATGAALDALGQAVAEQSDQPPSPPKKKPAVVKVGYVRHPGPVAGG